MNLSGELAKIAGSSAREDDDPKHWFWRLNKIADHFWALIEIVQEMAKRIEELEQREHSHPLGVGSLATKEAGE